MFALLWGFGKSKKMKVSKCEGNYGYPSKNNRSRPSNQIKRYYTTQIGRDSSLGPYLAGLIEGDGYIGVQNPNFNTKVLYRPKIIIAFNINDKPLAEKLSAELKVGKVINKEKAGHVLLQILAKEEVLKIINLINGNMRTPKIEALHRAISWINEKDNTTISCLGLDLSPLDSNSWLAGFTDGKAGNKGGFSLHMLKRKHNIRFMSEFKLTIKFVFINNETNKQIGNAYFSIISKISEYLNTNFITRVKHLNNLEFLFLIIARSPQSLEKVSNYYKNFSLLSNKAFQFMVWEEARLMILDKKDQNNSKLMDIRRKLSIKNNKLNPNFNFYNLQMQKKYFSTMNSRVHGTMDLEIWGKNLPSLIGIGRLTKLEREMIKLPSLQYSVIIGLLLSDGWLSFASSTNKNARLGFKQSLSRSDYVWFVFNLLSHYCSINPHLTKGLRNGKPLYALQILTRSIPCFTDLYHLFYVNKIKIIPNDIYELFTPIAFAHLVMGDGSYKSKGLVLCTDSFSLFEVVKLMNVLIIKYELKCTLHVEENRYRIYISRTSMDKVVKIIKPYLIPSMYYKIGIAN